MKSFVPLASSFALGLLAVTAGAREPAEAQRSLTVKYADLNLESEAGAQTLFHRIQGAARSVCGPITSTSFQERRAYNDCTDAAVSEAVARVDRPMLTHYAATNSETPVRVASGR